MTIHTSMRQGAGSARSTSFICRKRHSIRRTSASSSSGALSSSLSGPF